MDSGGPKETTDGGPENNTRVRVHAKHNPGLIPDTTWPPKHCSVYPLEILGIVWWVGHPGITELCPEAALHSQILALKQCLVE